ncbi:MAG: OmpA family protein [Dysgonomonas sp.]
MINRKIKVRVLSCLLLSALSLNAYSKDLKEIRDDKQNKKAVKIEQKADGKYVRQEFDNAMKLYESALKNPMTDEYAAILHLKTARQYLTLLNYSASISHFEKAMSLNENLFTNEDVCNYLDALRYSGDKLRAIVVARNYVYRDSYKGDQRYLNILHALDYEDGFYPVGIPEYIVRRLDNLDTPYAEFWVGRMNNEYFYATSNSQFHDPSKKFYHRTKYYSLDENSEYSINSHSKKKKGHKEFLHMIPIDLQNGPLSFSKDMSRMIVTSVDYNKDKTVEIGAGGAKSFKTKLYLSKFDKKRNGWSAFELAFPQNENASYAHPFLFNNDQSLLFSSDMEGGYGGYDLYVSNWDSKLETWTEPINLGAYVNTEGDEISPTIADDLLIFASNGHIGFGGYDLYSIFYENGSLVYGSLNHFDYPINSVTNDFSMLRIDKDRGYVISDRKLESKDDVYYFERNKLYHKDNLIYGMTESKAITNGAIDLVNNEGTRNRPRHENVNPSVFSDKYTKSQSMLSIYFDFDKFNVNSVAENVLKEWIGTTDFSQIQSLVIDGYTDELGSEGYNYKLSEQRAKSIAAWLEAHGIEIPVQVHGRGQLILNKEEQEGDTPSIYVEKQSYLDSILNHKIWMNRKARRVEVRAKMK